MTVEKYQARQKENSVRNEQRIRMQKRNSNNCYFTHLSRHGNGKVQCRLFSFTLIFSLIFHEFLYCTKYVTFTPQYLIAITLTLASPLFTTPHYHHLPAHQLLRTNLHSPPDHIGRQILATTIDLDETYEINHEFHERTQFYSK